MNAASIVEERLGRVEREVEELRRRLDRIPLSENWLARVAGSLKEHPEFDEVLRLGREIRLEDGPKEESAA